MQKTDLKKKKKKKKPGKKLNEIYIIVFIFSVRQLLV